MPPDAIGHCRAHKHAGPKCRRRIVIIGVGRRIDIGVGDRLLHDNDAGIITGHIDNFRFGGNDLDDFFFLHDCNLFSGFKISRLVSLGTKPLHRVHHVFLLIDNGVAQVCGPVQVLVHFIDDVGVIEQTNYAAVPSLIGLQFRIGFMFFQVAGGLNDV